MENYKYDIAISFAGEQRELAETIAHCLHECGVGVFLDSWNEERLWGKDLTKYFDELFSERALFAVVLFSKEYNEKMWPMLEYEMMQYREYSTKEEYILPILIDGTMPDNWPKTRGYLDVKNYSLDELVLMIRDKVRARYKSIAPNVECKQHSTRNIMRVINEDGAVENVEVILAFEFKDDRKEFVIYTKDEQDSRGNTTVYVSQVIRNGEEPLLMGVEDADWFRVKEVLWNLSNSDNANSTLHLPLKPFLDKDGFEIM